MKDTWDDFWAIFQGTRKFFIMLVVFTIAVVFRAKDLVNGAQVVELLKDITLAYLASNSAEHVTNAVQTHYAAKAAPAADPAPQKSAEEATKQELETLQEES